MCWHQTVYPGAAAAAALCMLHCCAGSTPTKCSDASSFPTTICPSFSSMSGSKPAGCTAALALTGSQLLFQSQSSACYCSECMLPYCGIIKCLRSCSAKLCACCLWGGAGRSALGGASASLCCPSWLQQHLCWSCCNQLAVPLCLTLL